LIESRGSIAVFIKSMFKTYTLHYIYINSQSQHVAFYPVSNKKKQQKYEVK